MFGNRNNHTLSEYDSLVQRLKSGDLAIDFTALRVAYTHTPNYAPNDPSSLEAELSNALRRDDTKRVLHLANEMLDKDYTNGRAHAVVARCCRQENQIAKADYHDAIWGGLYASICESGDGRSPANPLIVTNVLEEYFFLTVSRLECMKRGLISYESKHFDRMQVQQVEGRQILDIYFDVSLFYGK